MLIHSVTQPDYALRLLKDRVSGLFSRLTELEVTIIHLNAGYFGASLWRASRCSRVHCTATKPSKTIGTMRCQPSARPAWRAVPRIFGSSKYDGAFARAARSAIARCLTRRRTSAEII